MVLSVAFYKSLIKAAQINLHVDVLGRHTCYPMKIGRFPSLRTKKYPKDKRSD